MKLWNLIDLRAGGALNSWEAGIFPPKLNPGDMLPVHARFPQPPDQALAQIAMGKVRESKPVTSTVQRLLRILDLENTPVGKSGPPALPKLFQQRA
jgi:hypothetical protein